MEVTIMSVQSVKKTNNVCKIQYVFSTPSLFSVLRLYLGVSNGTDIRREERKGGRDGDKVT